MRKSKLQKSFVYKTLAFSLIIPIVLTPIVTSVASAPSNNEETTIFLQTRLLISWASQPLKLKKQFLGSEIKLEADLVNSEIYKSFVQWAIALPYEQRFDKQLFIDKIVRLPLSFLQKQYIFSIYLDQIELLRQATSRKGGRSLDSGEDSLSTTDRSMVAGPKRAIDDPKGPNPRDKKTPNSIVTASDKEIASPIEESKFPPYIKARLNKEKPKPKPATFETLLDPSLFVNIIFANAPTLKVLYTPQKGYIVVNTKAETPIEFEIFDKDKTYSKLKKNQFLLNGDKVVYYAKQNGQTELKKHVRVINELSNFEFVPEGLLNLEFEKEIFNNNKINFFDNEFYCNSVASFEGRETEGNLLLWTIHAVSRVPGYTIPKIFRKFSYIDSKSVTIVDLKMDHVPNIPEHAKQNSNSTEFSSTFSIPTYGDARVKVTGKTKSIDIQQINSDNFLKTFVAPTKIERLFFYVPLEDVGYQKLMFDERMVKEFEVVVYDRDDTVVKRIKETNVEPNYRKLRFNNLPGGSDKSENIANFVLSFLSIIATAGAGAIAAAPTTALIALAKALWSVAITTLLPPAVSSAISAIVGGVNGYPELAGVPWGIIPKNVPQNLVLTANVISAVASFIGLARNIYKIDKFDSFLFLNATIVTEILRTTSSAIDLKDLMSRLIDISTIVKNKDSFFKNDLLGINSVFSPYSTLNSNGNLIPDNINFWAEMAKMAGSNRRKVNESFLPVFDFASDMRKQGVSVELKDVIVPQGGRIEVSAIYGAHVAAAFKTLPYHWWSNSRAYFDLADQSKRGQILIEGRALSLVFDKNAM